RQSTVNWCPGCNTILANEQVRDDGTCWRGHPGVTTRSVPEWAFRITAYAEELLRDLDTLSAWPERIVTQQRHWIGKSVGARVRFPVQGHDRGIEVFTTRVDTIYGCTYIVLAPEHPLALELTTPTRRGEVEAFIERMRQQDRIARTAEGGAKEGVFTGATAVNPYTGEPVPVWLANFVLAEYGTGAVMSVPAHDARDHAFAEKYGLPVRRVISPAGGGASATGEAHTADGVLVNSGPFTGLGSAEARVKMAAHAQDEGFGEATTSWHLRDWGFSRQRYWGTPIPIIYCDEHGAVPVPEADLPVRLPDFAEVELTGQGGAPLAKLDSFVQAPCPRCGKPGKREVETMDTFVDSAWYFARFLNPGKTDGPLDAALAKAWLPVDIYVGGPEHAVMHLLYFRFWTKAMRDLGLVTVDEPVKRLITQGMVNAQSFKCATHGYVPAAALRDKPESERACPKCGGTLSVAVEKMSKSKYNGIDPMELIATYGADTARLYTLFAAPPEKDLEWSQAGVDGLHRFVGRIWRLMTAQAPRVAGAALPTEMGGLAGADAAVRRAVHRTLAKVSEEMSGRNHFNTAIAAMMELTNTLHEHKLHEGGDVAPGVAREALLLLAQMLAPFAPHLAESIWQGAGGEGLVATTRWPTADPAALVEDSITLAVQVNGKLRGQVQVPPKAEAATVVEAARRDGNVARHLEGKQVVKQIYVPGRMLNFVVRDA
ncbi:MAG TPA: leucine--tRNA ligase, partial [Myxococcota bacterium]|nr:leucine--tRNA ligase [Myxococcota bacterium]